MAKAKIRNTKRLYEFWLEHPTWSYKAVGKIFHVTRQRASQIINKHKDGSETHQNQQQT